MFMSIGTTAIAAQTLFIKVFTHPVAGVAASGPLAQRQHEAVGLVPRRRVGWEGDTSSTQMGVDGFPDDRRFTDSSGSRKALDEFLLRVRG